MVAHAITLHTTIFLSTKHTSPLANTTSVYIPPHIYHVSSHGLPHKYYTRSSARPPDKTINQRDLGKIFEPSAASPPSESYITYVGTNARTQARIHLPAPSPSPHLPPHPPASLPGTNYIPTCPFSPPLSPSTSPSPHSIVAVAHVDHLIQVDGCGIPSIHCYVSTIIFS